MKQCATSISDSIFSVIQLQNYNSVFMFVELQRAAQRLSNVTFHLEMHKPLLSIASFRYANELHLLCK